MPKELKAAIAARDAYLKKHPRLAEYQAEIDRVLDATPEQLRVETLSIMVAGKVTDLQAHLARLVNTFVEVTRC